VSGDPVRSFGSATDMMPCLQNVRRISTSHTTPNTAHFIQISYVPNQVVDVHISIQNFNFNLKEKNMQTLG